MQVIIYGKTNCPNCEKTKMLCRMKSVDFQYLVEGQDYNAQELTTLVGHEVRSVPQIFIKKEEGQQYVGVYEDLRNILST